MPDQGTFDEELDFQRSTSLRVVAVIAAFFGGGALGVLLGWLLAPDSWLAGTVSMLMLPLSFVVGMQLWLGLALVLAVARLVRRLISRSKKGNAGILFPKAILIPEGSFVFVPVAAAISLIAGIVCGAAESSAGFLLVSVVYFMVGLLYGVWLWKLAARGYLPFPVES